MASKWRVRLDEVGGAVGVSSERLAALDWSEFVASREKLKRLGEQMAMQRMHSEQRLDEYSRSRRKH